MPLHTILKDKPSQKSLCLLTTFSGETELQALLSLLEEARIPLYVKNRGASSYARLYAVSSVFGGEAFVKGKDYKRAKELVALFRAEAENNVLPEDDLTRAAMEAELPKEEPASHQRGSLVAALITLGVMVACLMAVFIVSRFLEI